MGTAKAGMTRRNSEADSIVWIVEGNHDRTRVVSERIYVPETFIVFGIFLKNNPPQIPPVPVLTPRSFFLARRFLFWSQTARCPVGAVQKLQKRASELQS
jgi:hypothetical protein